MTLLTELRVVLGRPRLILLAYGLRSAAALALAWGWQAALAPGWVMALPSADHQLFAPGAVVVARVIAERLQTLTHLLRLDALAMLGLLVFGTAASAVVVSGLLASRGDPVGPWLRRGLRLTPRYAAIVLAGWLLAATGLAVALLLMRMVPTIVYPALGEIGADCALALLALAAAAAALWAMLLSDLARAAAAAADLGFGSAFGRAFRCSNRQRLRCATGILGFVLPACAAPPFVEWCLPSAAATTGGLPRVIIHQATILGACALHLGWWLRALRVVQAPRQIATYN